MKKGGGEKRGGRARHGYAHTDGTREMEELRGEKGEGGGIEENKRRYGEGGRSAREDNECTVRTSYGARAGVGFTRRVCPDTSVHASSECPGVALAANSKTKEKKIEKKNSRKIWLGVPT